MANFPGYSSRASAEECPKKRVGRRLPAPEPPCPMKKLIILLALATSTAGAANFEVFPAEVNLKFMRDRQSLVCRITEPNGIQRNVTTDAKFTVSDPTKFKVEKGVVFPIADGLATLKVEFAG